MKKKLILMAIMLAAALILSGCMDFSGMEGAEPEPEETAPPLTEPMYEDEAALYQYYNQVTFEDTLEKLKEKLGEPQVITREGGSEYRYVQEDGYGVAVGAYPDGRVRGKVVIYEDLRQLGKLSGMTSFDEAYNITKDYTFRMCRIALGGTPMEILQTAADQSINPDIQRLYVWANERGDLVQILFTGDGKVSECIISPEPDREGDRVAP